MTIQTQTSSTYKIATQFSSTPGPRHESEGDFSGEVFREHHLKSLVRSAIDSNQILIIDLDGAAGFAPSFLEESFGGLIREDKFSKKELLQHIRFISEEEPYLIDEIMKDIEDAHNES